MTTNCQCDVPRFFGILALNGGGAVSPDRRTVSTGLGDYRMLLPDIRASDLVGHIRAELSPGALGMKLEITALGSAKLASGSVDLIFEINGLQHRTALGEVPKHGTLGSITVPVPAAVVDVSAIVKAPPLPQRAPPAVIELIKLLVTLVD